METNWVISVLLSESEAPRRVIADLAASLSGLLPKEIVTYKRLTDEEIPARIRQVKAEHNNKIVRKRQTAFDALLDSDLPEHEKSEDRLTGEAQVFLIAGTDTTSWTLTVATYYLFQQPDLITQVTEELRAVANDPRDLPSWSALEQLPLLGAVVNESLRLSYGLTGRSSRVPTQEDLVYRGSWTPRSSSEVVKVEHVVPKGWSISMSTPIFHHNESIFPDSEKFKPERWLDESGKRRKDLERFLFSVSVMIYCLGCLFHSGEFFTAVLAVFSVFSSPLMLNHSSPRVVAAVWA